MACDNLRPGTFNSAMKTIKQNYDDLVPAYKKMKAAADDMKAHWHTPKGYEEVNMFLNRIGTCVNAVSSVVYNNYNEMKNSAKKFADKEKMSINVQSLGNKHKQERVDDKMGATEDGSIDDTALGNDSKPVSNARQAIIDCLDAMYNITSSPEKFGYWSTGGTDPRDAMHRGISNMKTRVTQIIDTFNNDLFDKVQADKEDRENAKKTQFQNFGMDEVN